MSINEELDLQLSKIQELVSKNKDLENNTVYSSLILNSVNRNIKGFSYLDYKNIVNNKMKYNIINLSEKTCNEVVEPIGKEIDVLIELLRKTNSIKDKYLSNYFESMANYIRSSVVIHDREIRKQNENQLILGKIKSIDFQSIGYLDGFVIEFSLDGGNSGVIDITKRWNSKDSRDNHSLNCDWTPSSSIEYMVESVDFISKIMKDAKVKNMSEMVDVPVEVSIKNMQVISFRVLTEVL